MLDKFNNATQSTFVSVSFVTLLNGLITKTLSVNSLHSVFQLAYFSG